MYLIRFYPWWKWIFLFPFIFFFISSNFFILSENEKKSLCFSAGKIDNKHIMNLWMLLGHAEECRRELRAILIPRKNDKEEISLKIYRLWSLPSSKVIHRIFFNRSVTTDGLTYEWCGAQNFWRKIVCGSVERIYFPFSQLARDNAAYSFPHSPIGRGKCGMTQFNALNTTQFTHIPDSPLHSTPHWPHVSIRKRKHRKIFHSDCELPIEVYERIEELGPTEHKVNLYFSLYSFEIVKKKTWLSIVFFRFTFFFISAFSAVQPNPKRRVKIFGIIREWFA